MTNTLVRDPAGLSLNEALERVDRGEEVTIERRNGSRLVLLPPGILAELELLPDFRRRQEAWRQLEAIRARVSARNQDLTPEQVDELADQIVRDAIDSLTERGVLRFERDRSVRIDDESAS